jgi:hypothetical protein
MPEDEMIIPEADAPAEAPQTNNDNNGQPTPPAEVEGTLIDNDEPANTSDDASSSASQDTGSTAEAISESGESTEGTETPPNATAAEAQPKASQPAPQLTDPGEFQPKDYSFDVTLADGQVIKVAKPEDIDNIPADADFGTPANLAKMQAAYTKMVVGIENDKRDYDKDKSAFEAEQESNAAIEQNVTTMMNEMAYLETKGRLPAVGDKYKEADWSDPEVAKQPGVKERLELLNYRAQENKQREKLGLSPMSVLEASMQMAQDQAEQKAADVKEKQGGQRKAKGALIGGATASSFDSTPDDMIIGAGGSIRDIGL